MKTRTLMSVALSALALAGAGVSFASAPDEAAVAKAAAVQAKAAGAALTRGKADEAVRFAEAAVAARPHLVDYRVLLGQSYLKAGRFAAARAAFTDALSLAPGNGKAALNLALVETGLGDWAAARETLTAHAATIPAADRGLATALAGDPAGAVEILTAATRAPDADVKTRQNLALAMALNGYWAEARAVAMMDLSPADVDGRLEQWAAFAHPAGAADQVASLLGVTPVADAGQPVALALATPAPVRMAQATPAPEFAAVPAAAPVMAAVPAVAPIEAAKTGVVFAAASAVVQPLPAAPAPAPESAPRALAAPYKLAVKAPARAAAPAKGDWFVQIGAYDNASVARNDWARATRRDAAFRPFVPNGMAFQARAGQVYRLSVGGFAHVDADALCRGYRAKGGRCFVRQGAGDQVASWVKPSKVQLASR